MYQPLVNNLNQQKHFANFTKNLKSKNMNTNRMSGKTIVLLCVKERLNLAQVPNLQNYFLPLMNQSNHNIIFDLQFVRYMDCHALGYIVSLNQIARKNNNKLILCNLTENVRLLAEIMKLSQIIEIDNTKRHNTGFNLPEKAIKNQHSVKSKPIFNNI